ncbi:MAG: TlpA family protein disulfide reductase [Acidobacteria bacterium]|nr:TlpA family protein disulfide reductase [Acidobacteriota bacterium]
MKKQLRKMCVGGLVAGFILASFSIGALAVPSSIQPSWDLLVVGGGRQSLADLRGNVVVASFGATWCPPCRAELPALQALADKYQGRRVKAVWISIDDKKITDQELAQFAQKHGLRGVPVLRDLNRSAFDQFGQPSVPMLVVVDKQGNLVGRPHLGFSDKDSYLQRISSLIDSAL